MSDRRLCSVPLPLRIDPIDQLKIIEQVDSQWAVVNLIGIFKRSTKVYGIRILCYIRDCLAGILLNKENLNI